MQEVYEQRAQGNCNCECTVSETHGSAESCVRRLIHAYIEDNALIKVHRDLHQGNVLVEEIEKDGKLELIAWLVDWGWIKWRLVQWRIATAEELQKFVCS